MTSRPEVSPDVVAVDLSRFSSRTFCSWNDLGWRSVLLRRFENAPATDNVYHEPVKDQLLVLVWRGHRDTSSAASSPSPRSRSYAASAARHICRPLSVKKWDARRRPTGVSGVPEATLRVSADELASPRPSPELAPTAPGALRQAVMSAAGCRCTRRCTPRPPVWLQSGSARCGCR
jgi:hypothetical protein